MKKDTKSEQHKPSEASYLIMLNNFILPASSSWPRDNHLFHKGMIT